MNTTRYNLVVVLGATASGKTKLAACLASEINGEIISADSRQVYSGMDIGTGKDLQDYYVDSNLIPYHLIDIRAAGEKYNVFEYQKDFYKAYENISNRGKFPVLCGGTGLYIESVVNQYKLVQVPENNELRKKLENKSLEELKEILSKYKILHNNTDTDTLERAIRGIEIEVYYDENPQLENNFPEIRPLLIGVKFDRLSRRNRISERLKERLQNGMVDEVCKLMDQGVSDDVLIYYGLEYKFITLYIKGQLSYYEMFKKLETAIHQFSKRQQTWFRKMERDGHKIHWLDGYMGMEEKLKRIKHLLYKEEVNLM
jgi:tRNA dimethylallyltransferase